jgi:hypothetical protein
MLSVDPNKAGAVVPLDVLLVGNITSPKPLTLNWNPALPYLPLAMIYMYSCYEMFSNLRLTGPVAY